MPLIKLFPIQINYDGKPAGLHPCTTHLRAYNGTDIPQCAFDSSIKWKDTKPSQIKSMNTTWYVTDTPGPANLALHSCSHLGIVHLNCSVEFCKHGTSSPKPASEKSSA